MIGIGFWWVFATLGTGLLGFLGYKGVKKLRARKNAKAKREIKGAWRAHRKTAAAKPRAQLRAKRKTQPHRLILPGRVRAADDPGVVRRAVAKRQLTKLNKAGERIDNPKPSLVDTVKQIPVRVAQVSEIPNRRTEQQVEDTMTTCQAFTTDGDGTCRRPAKHDNQGNTLFHCGIPSHARQFAGRKATG